MARLTPDPDRFGTGFRENVLSGDLDALATEIHGDRGPGARSHLTTSDVDAYRRFVTAFTNARIAEGVEENEAFDMAMANAEVIPMGELDAWYATQGVRAPREPIGMRTWQDDQGVWHTTTSFDDGTEETRLATNSDARSVEDGHPDWNMDGTRKTVATPAGPTGPLFGRDPAVVTQPDTAAIDFFDQPGLAQQWALQHFPWAKDLNLGRMIEAAVTEGIDDDVLIAQVRDTPQYLATFPGITDEDGRMRFVNEQAYVDQVREYRNVLIDAGSIGSREIFNPRTENPVDYATLMERGISTDELQNRLDTYRDLTNNSAHVRATFKIYANMDVSVDDLYQAVVDPEASRTLIGRYNENLLNANFDYSNWVANATSAALEATAETLSILEAQGALPEGAVARINALTDQQAQGLVEALYLGDPDNEDPLLDLDELIEAFQFALIGGAAAEQGLVAPSMARVGAFRQAGITRATALKGYGAYVNQGSMIESMLSRTNIQGEGAARFGQEDFENAVFLSQAPEVDLITRARQDEMARGRAPGGFATTSRGARLAQPGRTGGGVRY